MYCSSCGGVVAQNLSYCNRCGAKLSGAKSDGGDKPAELFPDSLIWAIVAVFCVGIGTTIGLMAMLKELLNLGNGPIIAFGLLILLMTFVVESVFISMLSRRNREAKKAGGAKGEDEHETKEIIEARARALPEPVPSVTENTTRSFEPIYSERKSE